MSTSRNQGKHYQPVLCRIKLFPASRKSVVIIPHECSDLTGLVLPFKDDAVLMQRVLISGELSQPTNPSQLTGDQRADAMGAPWVIMWVANWLLVNFDKEGKSVEVMTPATPVKAAS